MSRAVLELKSRRCGPAIGRHPWVFNQAIHSIQGEPKDGEIVDVRGEGRFLAYGIFNSKSEIRARLYSWDEKEELTSEFFENRIQDAIQLRKELGLLAEDSACRLIFSEGDRLSGLIVDYFAGHLVCQINSRAFFERKDLITEVLVKALNPKSIYLKRDSHISKLEGIDFEDAVIYGNLEESVTIKEDGLEFEVDLRKGQKTGFFTDQALNRKAVAAFAHGGRALDLCCYTGGFAMHLAKSGAQVTAVDSSAEAVARAKKNAERNKLDIQFAEEDIFDWMKSYEGEKFDLVVLDPPRLAPSRSSKPRALKTYFRMNEEALRLVKPGGYFVSCSCSGQISREEFFSVLASVARRSKRSIQILFQWGQSPDHPVISSCPETMYLKTFVCKVVA